MDRSWSLVIHSLERVCASVFTDVLVNLSLCALSLILTYVILVSSKVMSLVILCSCRQSSSVVFWRVMYFILSLLYIFYIQPLQFGE